VDDQGEAVRERPHLGSECRELGGAVEVGPLVKLLAEEGAVLLLRREIERAHAMEHIDAQILETLSKTLELVWSAGGGGEEIKR